MSFLLFLSRRAPSRVPRHRSAFLTICWCGLLPLRVRAFLQPVLSRPSVASAWVRQAPHFGFPKIPSIVQFTLRPLLLPSPMVETTSDFCFGPPSPGGRSRSALVVSHHLDGFLRRVSCGFVAPRCRSWGSSRSGIPPRHWVSPSTPLLPARDAWPFEACPRQQPSPSPRHLPSCCSPSGDGSAPGPLSADRVRRGSSVLPPVTAR